MAEKFGPPRRAIAPPTTENNTNRVEVVEDDVEEIKKALGRLAGMPHDAYSWGQIVDQLDKQGQQHRTQQSVKSWIGAGISFVIGITFTEALRVVSDYITHIWKK